MAPLVLSIPLLLIFTKVEDPDPLIHVVRCFHEGQAWVGHPGDRTLEVG